LPRSARSPPAAAPPALSRAAALAAFAGLERAQLANVARMPRTHQALAAGTLRYPAKLAAGEDVAPANGALARAIVACAQDELGAELVRPGLLGVAPVSDGGAVGRARAALRHFVRDWSAEGAGERASAFDSILDVLRDVPPAQRAGMRVLVPGCGLGRLAWEISELGTQ
jgi:hypothetical protein